MDDNTITDLIRGVGIIIDDEALTDEKEVQMIKAIQSEGIPVSVYDYIPDTSIIDSLGNISFVILDWEFSPEYTISGVDLGDELRNTKRETVLFFLKKLIEKTFVPVFLITGQTFSDVEKTLIEQGLYSPDKPNRIMLKSKSDIFDYDSLIKNVKDWIETTPSVLALKLWEKDAVQAKNRMFLEMYEASSDWVTVLLKLLMKDTGNNRMAVNNEFGELLTNNFVNRIQNETYYDIASTDRREDNAEEIRRVLQGGRYISYDEMALPYVSYVGDLYDIRNAILEDEFLMKYEYMLNIRAQCDLMRDDDPMLYLIPGKSKDRKEILMDSSIRISNEKKLIAYGREYPFEEMESYSKNKIDKFNNRMRDCEGRSLYYNGTIIEKNHHSIVSCIANEYLIEFSFKDFVVKRKSELESIIKGERIGRLIPPYITKVQDSFSSYIVREGLLPIPDVLFGI